MTTGKRHTHDALPPVPKADLEELARLAEAAEHHEQFEYDSDAQPCTTIENFHRAASPSVVIGLLNRIQELEDQLSTGGNA